MIPRGFASQNFQLSQKGDHWLGENKVIFLIIFYFLNNFLNTFFRMSKLERMVQSGYSNCNSWRRTMGILVSIQSKYWRYVWELDWSSGFFLFFFCFFLIIKLRLEKSDLQIFGRTKMSRGVKAAWLAITEINWIP